MAQGTPAGPGRRSLRRWLPLLLIILLVALFFLFGLQRYVSLASLRANHEWLAQTVAAHLALALLAFVLIYVVVVALSLPGATVLTLAGGWMFGQWMGTGATVVAATGGATLLSLAARTAFGDSLRRRAGPWLRRLQEGFQADAFNYLLFLRLVPLFPFFVVNLVPAVIGVPSDLRAGDRDRHHSRPSSSPLSALRRARVPGGQWRDHPQPCAEPAHPDGAWRARPPRLAARPASPLAPAKTQGGANHRGIQMSPLLTPDICVIGAGTAGLVTAAGASQLGAATVLIEAERMGGDCLNTGCVPSKALLAAAHAATAYRRAAAFGITQPPPVVDFAKVQAHVQGVIEAIAPNDPEERFAGLGVQVIRAPRPLHRAAEVAAGDLRIRARRFVVATGSSPAVPPVPGLADLPYLTNETVFDLDRLPDHLLVMGGGPIGCELAQAFRRLGARVSLVEMASLLPKDDPELVAVSAA
jgi:uncharacterized membrane protein YdjX (TVP38/TMEM64 family)